MNWTVCFRLLERELAWFSILVPVLAFAAFMLGGSCAAWQWWVAAAAAVTTGFCGRRWRDGVCAGLFFVAWMAVVWIGCGLAVAPGWFDESVYHIPAVRMLADGWNPIYVSTPEDLLRVTGFGSADIRVDHVLFIPKTVWVFSAVAYFFTNDLLNPLVPILWFLVPAVLMRIWRSMEGAATIWKILAVPLVCCLLLNSAYVVDVVVQLAAVGLLLSFEEVLSRRRIDVLSLVFYSFWMMGAKTPGLLHGCLFWTMFLAFALAKKVDWRPLAKVVAAVTVLLAVVCSSPYLTSIHHYGHPFYPNCSFDEKRFPVRNITEDFTTGQNEDAASMGHVGRYVNSFVSPSLARAWYRWRLQKPDFMPFSSNYCHYPTEGDGSSPTRFGMRVAFWASAVLLLLFGRRSFRPLLLMIMIGMAAVPTPMVGYVRYVPWWLCPALFVYLELTCNGGEKWRRALACIILLGVFSIRPYTLIYKFGYSVSLVDERRRLLELLDGKSELAPVRPCAEWSLGRLRMMRREFPPLAKAELLPYSREKEEKFKRANLELPGKIFVFDDEELMRRHAHTVPDGVGRRMEYVLRICVKTLPLAIAERVGSLFKGCGKGTK